MSRSVALIAVLLAVIASLSRPVAGCDECGGKAKTVASKPAVLLPGREGHHHPVSTRNEEAQKFFDQGLILVYAFNHEEAIRSFQRAAELDPQMSMAHWGIAL